MIRTPEFQESMKLLVSEKNAHLSAIDRQIQELRENRSKILVAYRDAVQSLKTSHQSSTHQSSTSRWADPLDPKYKELNKIIFATWVKEASFAKAGAIDGMSADRAKRLCNRIYHRMWHRLTKQDRDTNCYGLSEVKSNKEFWLEQLEKLMAEPLESFREKERVFQHLDDFRERHNTETDHVNHVLFREIESLKLTRRSLNCLRSIGIRHIGDLIQYGESDLATIPNYGRACREDVKNHLAEIGLSLGANFKWMP